MIDSRSVALNSFYVKYNFIEELSHSVESSNTRTGVSHSGLQFHNASFISPFMLHLGLLVQDAALRSIFPSSLHHPSLHSSYQVSWRLPK